jgi:TPP-dependent pyruvate/acetoin dehydrogenase alpha subunit
MTTETVQSAAGVDAATLVRMYRQLVAIRLFEERANDLIPAP